MLTKLSSQSSNRRRLGTSVAALLALAIGFAAWAADTETRATGDGEMFSFDIEITVDGVREEGTLTIIGDEVVVPIADGEPLSLARERLLLEHESDDSGWSAQIEVTRASDETFWVAATILKNNKVVAASKNIIKSGAPLSIEQTDPDTGDSTYRINITPVGLSSSAADGAEDEADSTLRSAQVFLTVDGNTAGKRVEWPGNPGGSMQVGFDYTGEPEPWHAQLDVERLNEEQVKMCLDKLELALESGVFSASAGCMIIDITAGKNGYMFGKLGEIGVSFRMDMVPNVHDEIDAENP